MTRSIRQNIIIVIGLFLSVSLFGQTQTTSLKITHLTGDFYVFTTYRTFKDKPMSSNGLYFLTDKGAVMIDTPWDTTQFQPLLDSIEFKHKKKVVLCIATHSHEDRTGGLEFFKQKGIKTFTTKQTDEICKEHGEKRAEFYFTKDTTFKVGNYSFQTFYGGEGHTKDNIAIWFGKDKILYGGCAIKSIEATDLGYIGESNLKAWPTTLTNIKRKFPTYKFIIPGHQGWTSVKSLDHTLDLLRQNQK
jgi:glyoxylase-like metal-dependent hydrolase (beta-lactamase superfamily II)